MAGYKELLVWQKSMDLIEEIYRVVKYLPKEEHYALGDQMRRAAVSIPSNIAEGHGRASSRVFIHFISIAQGSVAELETQLEICIRLHYVAKEQAESALRLCDEVGKMLRNLTRTLANSCN